MLNIRPSKTPFSNFWLLYFQTIIAVLPSGYEDYLLQILDRQQENLPFMAYEQVYSLIKFVIDGNPALAFAVYTLCYPPGSTHPHVLLNTIEDKLKSGGYCGHVNAWILQVILWSGRFAEIVEWVGIQTFKPVIQELPLSSVLGDDFNNVDPLGVLFPSLICQMVNGQQYGQAMWLVCEKLGMVQSFGSQSTGIFILSKYLAGELARGMRYELFEGQETFANTVKGLVKDFGENCELALSRLKQLQ
eukprot:TRINITY_DN12091_c1_g1_i2.p1 TRINITY_DN12091_c1_g1~~TRINITY_DN12091_c1_g1_i2.p1  ORF type:complete len:276 (+),score=18.07 TRINITY_DN12091_c1_g1_i2:92-829(+)